MKAGRAITFWCKTPNTACSKEPIMSVPLQSYNLNHPNKNSSTWLADFRADSWDNTRIVRGIKSWPSATSFITRQWGDEVRWGEGRAVTDIFSNLFIFKMALSCELWEQNNKTKKLEAKKLKQRIEKELRKREREREIYHLIWYSNCLWQTDGGNVKVFKICDKQTHITITFRSYLS